MNEDIAKALNGTDPFVSAAILGFMARLDAAILEGQRRILETFQPEPGSLAN